MFHHFARALFVHTSPSARPIVVRTEPQLAPERDEPAARPPVSTEASRLRICSDPSDARRTVITGRFADVCAALDRMVMEQETQAN